MTQRAQSLWLTGWLALLLALPAIANGFPLVFPDSGTYLVIAFGREYAVDRSSLYGLMWKPFVTTAPGMAGLWLALSAQILIVAAVLAAALRTALSGRSGTLPILIGTAVVLLTSLPWHAAQIMPDAFTGAIVLLAWLAASRAPSANGAALLWALAAALATTHYTHPVLLGAATAGAVLAQLATGLDWRAGLWRLIAGAVAAMLAMGAMTAANGVALGRWTLSPTGGVFLFARAYEDGLVKPWLDRHCGKDAPAELCAVRGELPENSQAILWGDSDSVVTRHIWKARDDAGRWHWADMLSTSVRGAIREQPAAFLRHAGAGALSQFVHFAAIDDECPDGCHKPTGGIAFALGRYRPETVPLLMDSMQVRDTTPKTLIRGATGAVSWSGLLLLPVMLVMALRRKDGLSAGLLIAVAAALLVNATLAGALSDVHDRYQSRIVWLVPFAVLVALARSRFAFVRGQGAAAPVPA